MLEYHPDALTADEAVRLARHQTEISAKTTYQDQVSATGTWHPSKLGTAKDKLFAARPRNGRYVFCENDTGRDVEHLRPRQLHPDLTYNWDNLIAACGECNGPKGTQDAVLDSSQPGGFRSITREKKKKNDSTPVTPPPAGLTAWYNPRHRNPMIDIRLDIRGETFFFENTAQPGTPEHARVQWTLKKLALNERDTLVTARKVAFQDYCRWLHHAVQAQVAGDNALLARLHHELEKKNHPTVWEEMKRQRSELPEIDNLLSAVPFVLTW